MAKKLTKAHLSITLEDVVEATLESDTGFMHTPPKLHDEWISAGLVEINPELTDEYGCIATRATQAGIDSVTVEEVEEELVEAEEEEEEVGAEEAEEVNGFLIESGVGIPARTTRASKPDIYPFDRLETNQSFFVPLAANQAIDELLKTVQSSATRANKRHSEIVLGQYRTSKSGKKSPLIKPIRKFIARKIDGGVRVWRLI